MTDTIIRSADHPAWGMSAALARLNDALQAERPRKREQRIWETWAERCSIDRISYADAIWFIGHARDWTDMFTSLADLPGGWTRATWDRDGEEPALTTEVIDELEEYYLGAKAIAEADPTPAKLRDARDLYVAWQGLAARYRRTGNPDMGW